MTITAKYAGFCSVCGQSVRVGEKIEWAKGRGSTHVRCIGKTPEPLNSRPPAQMISADTDLVALAAQYGRALAGEPRLKSLLVEAGAYKLGDIEIAKRKDGSIVRRLILAVGKPSYYSADYLEDMDMFSMRPGRYSDVQYVLVAPSETEAADDAAKAAQAARKDALASLLRASYSADTHVGYSAPAGVAMTELHGNHRMAGSEGFYLGSDGIVYYTRSDYDMGPSWWRTSATPELIAEARSLGVPA